MRSLPWALRWLIVALGALLAVLLGKALAALWPIRPGMPLLITLLAGCLELYQIHLLPRAREQKVTFTLGHVARFLILTLYGPAWAVLAAALQALLNGWGDRVWYKSVFNMGLSASALWVSAQLIAWGERTLPGGGVVYIPLAAIGYVLLVNTGVALAVALTSGRSLAAIWREHFTWVSVQEGALAIIGLVLGVAVERIGWQAILLGAPLALLPITYQTYVRSQAEHTRELETFANQLISTLAAMVDARDAFTFGHSTHVSRYAEAMGRQMGWGPDQVERLRVGALLHDIGKVGVPEHVLFKPGRLDAAEYELMKQHAGIGYNIVSRIDRLRYAADIIHQHHERYDGLGYPGQLKGEEILAEARIVGVADALEAMISDRPYRKGCSVEVAVAEIERGAGKQFDPRVVTALQRVVQERGVGFFVNSAELVTEMQTSMAVGGPRPHPAAMALQYREGG